MLTDTSPAVERLPRPNEFIFPSSFNSNQYDVFSDPGLINPFRVAFVDEVIETGFVVTVGVEAYV